MKKTLTTAEVLQIATDAHQGQYRFDGKPYITHPIAVAEIAAELYMKVHKDVIFLDDIYQAALLHDVVEDTPITLDKLRELGVDPYVVMIVGALTKDGTKSYADMIDKISSSLATATVKLADLMHNSSDLKKGSMRDKYELAIKLILAKQPSLQKAYDEVTK